MNICTGCGKEATMSCPSCVKLGLTSGIYFCSQECFKANWAVHKLVHVLAAPQLSSTGADLLAKFECYEFTGKVRPALVSAQRQISTPKIPLPDYAINGIPSSELKRDRSNRIPTLSPKQLESLRKSCLIARKALDIGGRLVAPGVTGETIDAAVHAFIVESGAYPSPLNYHKFPKSICVSVNEVICHGIPDARPLESGDIVNLDISVFYEGMHSDLNETFIVGNADKDSLKLVETTYASLMAAIAIVKPGVMYRDLGNAIQRVAGLNGCSVVTSYCGHGVGEYFHCAPNIPHYANNKAVGIIAAGHVFTIEPMINLGTHKDKLWPDNWTAVTADGKRSAQFEHTLLVTETGCEILTARLPDSPSMGFDPSKLSIKK